MSVLIALSFHIDINSKSIVNNQKFPLVALQVLKFPGDIVNRQFKSLRQLMISHQSSVNVTVACAHVQALTISLGRHNSYFGYAAWWATKGSRIKENQHGMMDIKASSFTDSHPPTMWIPSSHHQMAENKSFGSFFPPYRGGTWCDVMWCLVKDNLKLVRENKKKRF